MKERLPIGIQEFSKLIEGSYIYVDKTEYLFDLINSGKYYFISRPRRFGKSLLINTLKEIFKGNKELFDGLWIYEKIGWGEHPVIHLDFSLISSREMPLNISINQALDQAADLYDLELEEDTNKGKFSELIQKLGQREKVAILIDEYDKPILDYLEIPEKAEENRQVIRNLYSVIKGNDSNIAFFFITGVSKFTQVSIFSELNNLNDITLDRSFAKLMGYTEKELRFYFTDYIKALGIEYEGIHSDIFAAIKNWYNGYSWDGESFVYNPFSILNLFFKQSFQDYWFQSGTPTFLIKLIKLNNYTIFDLKNLKLNLRYFNRFEISALDINSLMFQAGYLTIKHFDKAGNIVTLDFPNLEVEGAFDMHLLAEFTDRTQEESGTLLYQLGESLKTGQTDEFIRLMTIIFSNNTFRQAPGDSTSPEYQEKFYHSIFYLCLRLFGYQVHSEVLTSRGQIDTVVETPNFIYLIEFKIGEAESALDQIKKKDYQRKYLADGKTVILLGIGFDVKKRNIGSYLTEKISHP